MQQNNDGFTSKFGVIAAAAGSAIGLGNIWRFPYVLGENGGGAFLMVYLLFIVVLGIPLMLTELSIGRNSKKNPIGAFRTLGNKGWAVVGFLAVVAPLLTLSFYSAVAGWTLEYIRLSLMNAFAGQSPDQINQIFDDFIASDGMPVFWTLLFLLGTAGIVIAGVEKGIEKYTKALMPLLFIIIIILCIRSVTLDGASEGLKFLFTPDFSKINSTVILEALGQAFFSLSLGMGVILTYGSYINKEQNLLSTSISVSISDTAIAILAGVAIFPAVFAFGIEPGSGPGLVYKTLPNIFQSMTGGYVFSLMFFILLFIAAITSSVSLLEVVVACFHQEFNISRKKATFVATSIVMVLGIICALSTGLLSDFTIFGKGFSDLLEFIASNIILPLVGLCTVVFVGYFFSKSKLKKEIETGGTAKGFGIYMIIIKFIAPIAIAIVFLSSIGLFK